MYSGIQDARTWVLPRVLMEQASARGDAPWIISTTGETLTFGQAAEDARRVAGYFHSLGVKPGDRVGVMLPNSCDYIRAWMGLGMLGAVAVLLNTELRGDFLSHQLRNSAAAIMVADANTAAPVREVASQVPCLQRLLIVGELPTEQGGPMQTAWEEWRNAALYEGPLPRANDIAAIMYTSGTSGPSKGVLLPHAHCTLYGIGAARAFQLNDADRYYIIVPLFHVNGLLMQLGATLLAGIPAILRPRFSASSWLKDVQTHGATITNVLGAIAAFIIGQPASEADKQHKLRGILSGPNIPEYDRAFRERFGVRDVLSGFGMTECNIPVWGRLGSAPAGTAGWVNEDFFEVIIADSETDMPVPRGQVGEILVRPKIPAGFMAGYNDMPERTVEAWRNLWFHTGDAGTMDETGMVTFIDRIKDCIRRRGENISATEVEGVVAKLAGVKEVAAYPVPSDIPGGEDEIMLAVVADEDVSLTADLVGDHADRLLPRFASPRYVAFMDELPKTASGKVQRAELRKRGSAAAFDRHVPAKKVAGAN